mgnify:CR=1 FL=1
MKKEKKEEKSMYCRLYNIGVYYGIVMSQYGIIWYNMGQYGSCEYPMGIY